MGVGKMLCDILEVLLIRISLFLICLWRFLVFFINFFLFRFLRFLRFMRISMVFIIVGVFFRKVIFLGRLGKLIYRLLLLFNGMFRFLRFSIRLFSLGFMFRYMVSV